MLCSSHGRSRDLFAAQRLWWRAPEDKLSLLWPLTLNEHSYRPFSPSVCCRIQIAQYQVIKMARARHHRRVHLQSYITIEVSLWLQS